ncbi:HD domain-containing phosphohydrolase [Clostridium sp. CCUG 7971]|uniref:sensor domain-containing diguanylate cyclase/phosphohydrolase n=1 Tax=Clostridium sp. CCUG 7971 TaxID=2811414 RepID=UPI001ABB966F|nr:HD domain-containing phosphohydrolase [Clostridium sp. CCUG 7971]MBO3445053.1 diguanylate cyclase [Clostridium sp. CCUG 7971]
MSINETIFEFIPFPVWIKNSLGEIIYINKSFEINFNLSLEDFYNNISNIYKRDLVSYIKCIDKELTDIKKINKSLFKHIVFCDKSKDNKCHNWVGFLIDISNAYNEELENQRNILRTIIDNIPEIVFYKDNKSIYRGVNRHCVDFYENLGIDNVIGKTDLELYLDRDFVETCAKHDKVVIETKKQLIIDEEVPTEDGDIKIVETIKTPVINDSGDIWGIVGVVRDVTERKSIEKKLRYLSYTDVLTGLYNRAYFDEKIEELIKNGQFPIGIMIGDVNGLKIINDTIGHLEGDELLKEISKKLKEVFDEKGFIFRWGGDEFVILIPSTSNKECDKLMERLNSICKNYEGDKFKLSMSMGFSILNNEIDKVDKVLGDAEDKLYRQKILNRKSFRSSILHSLKESLQSKNVETEEHTERVANYATLIGKYLKLDSATIDELSLVGRLHDIGKIGIPERLLLKQDKLTDNEYEIMKTHSEKGYRLAMLLPELSHISRSILTHHERWDGLGYPLGLLGEEIPLVSRIIAVADSFDVMTTNRVYSEKKTVKEAINELRKCSGKQFDSNIVEAFCYLVESGELKKQYYKKRQK